MKTPNYSTEALQMMDVWELPDTQQAPGFDLRLVTQALRQIEDLGALFPGKIQQFRIIIRQVQASYLNQTQAVTIRRMLEKAAPVVEAKL